ncbi:MAG: rod shape-determining protein MreD [Deltaproteobacteria bacterium]|nr:rod shape-determining protein MreD [Deltaproteobacteria bacterium]
MSGIAKNIRAKGLTPAGAALALLAGGAFDLLFDGPHGRRFLWGFAPDASALVLVWLALRAETWAVAGGGFFLGFLRDGISYGPAGGWALVMVLEALLAKALMRTVEINRTWSACLVAFAAVLAGGIVLYPLLMYIYTGMNPVRVIYQHFSIYCIQGLTTALAGIPVFRFLDRAAAERRD